MKAAPEVRPQPDQTFGVSVSTVTACADAVHPPLLRTRGATTSLTLRGELTSAPVRRKRPVVVIVRRSYHGAPVGGRVFPEGSVLNVLVNLPPCLFADALALGLSGQLAAVEVTTEKLKHDMGAVFGVRFATGELRSVWSAGNAQAPSSSRAAAPPKTTRVPPRKRGKSVGRHLG